MKLDKASQPGNTTVQVAAPSIGSSRAYTVAAPAHVVQDLFLDQPGVRILFDDPLGPNVRDAVIEGFRRALYRPFIAA